MTLTVSFRQLISDLITLPAWNSPEVNFSLLLKIIFSFLFGFY